MTRASGSVAVLRWLVFGGSAAYLILFAVLACLRLRYPFELEWLEGASIDHVRTILSGRPLYGAPSLTFISLIYSPGYFYIGAALSSVMGVGFLPLRLLSIASTAGVFALLAKIAARETGDWHAGALARHQFASIVIEDGTSRIPAWLPLDAYYRPAEQVVNLRSRFWKPETRYVPR